jgi:hypothetical protein
MAARTKSKVTPKYKTKYRVTNWPAYEEALRERGDVTIWFDEAAASAWNAEPSGRPGGQQRYSDLAIETTLTLRMVFHLALRQTEGFVGSLIRLMGLELATPDHTTLSRRSSEIALHRGVWECEGPIHLIIDSTGLKIAGDGEWHAQRHRTANKRRAWRKLHLGVDAGGWIVMSAVTESGANDGTVGAELIEQSGLVLERLTADGAYDTRAVYEAVARAGRPGVRIVIPPRKPAVRTPHASGIHVQRNAAIERIEEVGRRQWRKEAGAHQQARAENGMYRYKRLIGERLRPRRSEAQKREGMIGVAVLNRMTELGRPVSERRTA